MSRHDTTTTLLLALSRAQLTDEDRQQVQALMQASVDWTQLAELAALHGVVALVRHNLLALEAQAQVPGAAWRYMQQAATQIAGDGMLLLRELARVVQALQGAGIDAVLLKGFALAHMLYEEPVLRPCADIDLLVRKEQLAAALTALEACGFQLPARTQVDFQLAYNYDLALTAPAGPAGRPTMVELHWDLAPRGLFALELSAWLSRSEAFHLRVGDHVLTLRRFSAEDMLLHLALHMRKHRYVGLRWLCDVSELLRRYQQNLDWDYLVSTARTAGLSLLLYTALTLGQRLLAAPVPSEVLARLRPGRLRRRLLHSVWVQDAVLAAVEMEEKGWTRLAPVELLLLDRPAAMWRELRFQLFKPAEAYHTPDAASRSRLALNARRLVRRLPTVLHR